SYSHLAKLVPGRPLYAFNFLEEATGWGAYADRIGQVDPDAPCLLFGYSGGGNLAFRTARELEARGRPVAAIVMLDSSRFLEAFPISVDEARRLASDFLESGGVAPVAANAVLRDKVVRKIERYYAALSNVRDHGVVAADIHVIVSENSP